jgi:hypothetical protein
MNGFLPVLERGSARTSLGPLTAEARTVPPVCDELPQAVRRLTIATSIAIVVFRMGAAW